METDSLLDIENLYVQYDTDDAVVHALNGLTLQVYRGEGRACRRNRSW